MTTQPAWSEVTPQTLRRALYIDFEGQKDQPPVLLGCATRTGNAAAPRPWQYISDPAFRPLAESDELESLTLPAAIERILHRAEKKDRQIVAWSEHELDVVRDHCPEFLERFECRYVNARSYAVRWRNKCYRGDKPAEATLAAYMALIGHAVPDHAGPGEVGTTIGRIRTSLAKGQGIAGLTDDQRHRWVRLREHNAHDCVGMRKVCLLAADEIAAQ